MRRFFLTVALAVFITAAAAGEVYAADGVSDGGPFFLRFDNFSVAVFGEVSVNAETYDEIWLFFSRLVSGGDYIKNKIYSFSSEIIIYNADINNQIKPAAFPGTQIFEEYGVTGDYIYYKNTMPGVVLRMGLSLIRASCVMILFSLRRGFFEQGCGSLANDYKSVLKAGFTYYFFAAALAVIFLLSAFLFPVSLILIVFTVIITLIGETSVAMYAGKRAAGLLRAGFIDESYGNTLLGLIIIETLRLIPYLDRALSFFVMPVVSSGVLCMIVLNAFFYKRFYYANKEN